MKKIIPALLAISILFSCGDSKKETQTEDLPVALGEEKSLGISKRYDQDLLESLYSELLNKDASLKKMNDNIREIEEGQSDSLKKFEAYDRKNELYFNSADRIVKEIGDSVLRKTLTEIIDIKRKAYQAKTAAHQKLINVINYKLTALYDRERSLKIAKTLPIIEKYQKEKFPNKNSILNLIQKIDQTKRLADTLYKK